MAKSVIGILATICINNKEMFPGTEINYVNNHYIQAVEKAGGVPVIIPVVSDEEVIENQIKNVDGIIIPGGYDVNPQCYGEEPQQELGFIFPEVDKFHLKSIEYCKKYNKPLLGICRGMQIINVAFGGSLYQDLSYINGCIIKHVQNSKRNATSHTVDVVQNSHLYKIIGDKVMTNSFHHQSVKKVAPGFKVSAVAKDGVVEAIESENDDFILGIQWHPEEMFQDSEAMLNIFKELIQISKY